MTEINEKAKQYFEFYPLEQVIHITTDGQVFLNANHQDAVNHQRQFTEKNAEAVLQTITRKSLTAEVEEVEVPDDTWTKAEIVGWLGNHNEEGSMSESKEELLARVQIVAVALAAELNDENENKD